MKAIIKTNFAAKVQASQFHPIEQSDGIEIEIEYTDQKDFEKQYEKLQKFIRTKVIESTMEGVKEFRTARSELFSQFKGED